MDLFSYLLVLVAIIVGLGMAQILADVAHMIQARDRVRVYWVHLVWLTIVFLMQVQYWFVLFSWRKNVNLGESFVNYLGNLAFPISLYVISVLLAPTIDKEEQIDYREYYYKQHRWVFGLCALSLTILILQSTFYLGYPLWHQSNAIRGAAIVLVLALACSANRILHAAAAIALLGLFFTFVARMAMRVE